MSVLVTPAIRFEPDGYVLSGPRLMGRQAAGNAFLRAAVAGRGGQPMWAHTPSRASAEVFGELVRELDPDVQGKWCPTDRLDILKQLGLLYLPGPDVAAWARLRLRGTISDFSICGITHTTASHAAMDAITGMLAAPVMPWDALICTSSAVLDTVETLLEAEIESMRWRFGADIRITRPQLPVIPLGVHCSDFAFSPDEREAAREALGIAPDEIMALFVGRLSFHAKAHPHQMYLGLQAAAKRTGKKIVLVQCGWFANGFIEKAFRDGAEASCPDVRCLYTDGKDAIIRRQNWAAADLFISLSDNIQETFGLTPIEAMAAGLPVVVTDWDGYKDTVRDGVDGFRIPSWMPPPGVGRQFALGHESGIDGYDQYCGLVCQTVSVDQRALDERLGDLVSNPELRRRLGEAGRKRAREVLDWTVVYARYQALWAELGEIRQAALAHGEGHRWLAAAPPAAGRLDPFVIFRHYPTHLFGPATPIRATPGADLSQFVRLAGDPLFRYASKMLPSVEMARLLLEALQSEQTVENLAATLQVNAGSIIQCLSSMAKMGLVEVAMTSETA